MKDITPILQSLGLLDSEIKTYLAALQHGAQTATDLSALTKLSRQATYVAIDALMKRGLMSSVLRGKKRFYGADHPEKLLAYAKRHEREMQERLKDLERMLPELELLMGGEKPIVRLYEGKEGVLGILEDIRTTDFKDSVEITDLVAMNAVLKPEELEGLRKALKQKNVRVRGLYAGTPASKTIVGAEQELLPKEFQGFKSNIGILRKQEGTKVGSRNSWNRRRSSSGAHHLVGDKWG